MKYEIQRTNQFKRDYKLAKSRGCNMEELKAVITMLANGIALSEKYKDHSLSGKYSGYRECHIRPDWLLVYKITSSLLILTLERTGSHSDIF